MKTSINCRGKLIDLSTPCVMGIINLTPDSFYNGGEINSEYTLLKHAEKHISEGATFLDIGAVSTRPGATDVSQEEEIARLIPAVELIRKNFPKATISVDTFRSVVARQAVDAGADLINDIRSGSFDDNMFETIAMIKIPYCIMHMQGTPKNMQLDPKYEDVIKEVFEYLLQRIKTLIALGVADIIVDPGFGFGKTVEHNYILLNHLNQFKPLEVPILVGISRKSIINKVLGTNPKSALNGTTAAHMVALRNGANVLRVHDVKEAVECVKIFAQMK